MSGFMLPDGRPLDDAEPQDVARGLADIFARLQRILESGGPSADMRGELAVEMGRASLVTAWWAEHGRWVPRRLLLAEKVAAKITPAHVNALVRAEAWTGDSDRFYELPDLIRDLLRHLTPEAQK